MTNTEHTTLRTKNTKALALSMLAILLAMFLALLAGPQQQARASVFYTLYTVNYTEDYPDLNPGDNACDALILAGDQCTLRAAIQESNAAAGTQLIHFGIPGTGVHTIQPKSNLPRITDTVTIDGYSQPGASENTLLKGTNAKLMIQLDGSTAGPSPYGLQVDAPNVLVKGLVINRFDDGITVYNDTTDAKIEGNFIGTDPSGTKARGNFGGVEFKDTPVGADNTLGGALPAARNLISGNLDGVVIDSASGNAVYGNLIGTQGDGKSPLGNSENGLLLQAYAASPDPSENAVGGSSPAYANTIAFNGGAGVCVHLYAPGDVRMSDPVLSNSVFSNKGLGIDLDNDGVTPNDAGDPDVGANGLQNHPLLASAKKGATGKTVVNGKLNSGPNRSYKLQFFSNPSGTNESKKLLGSKSVSTDGSGNVSFSFATTKKVALGQNITATATRDATGDTSEFSAPKKVVAS